jgi:hypothetical protein
MPAGDQGIRGCGQKPDNFSIAAEVYQVRPNLRGNRLVSDAQHVATKRALANLRHRGLVSGQQDISVRTDGTKILALLGQDGRHAERCCIWSMAARSEPR